MSNVIIIAAAALVVIAVMYFILQSFMRRMEENILKKAQDSFAAASHDTLAKNTEQFFQIAKEKLSQETAFNLRELEAKKGLIDQSLGQIKAEMEKVENLVTGLDKNAEGRLAAVDKGLQTHKEETVRLNATIDSLTKILSASKSRGEWGERMAEDILKFAGLQEGVSYIRQSALGQSRNRPDFTFLLPQNKIINMDVKFPFDNYRKYSEESSETARENYKKQFLRDARLRVKEITTRDYINTDADTLDYAIVFIPLEQAYSFIMEHDRDFMDEALRLKVIVCSPWTLYAFVSVIREAVRNFNLERSARQILNLMNDFNKQWSNYCESMRKMGERITALQGEYAALTSTRTNQLEKPLQQIALLMTQREMEAHDPGQSQNKTGH